MPLSYKGQIPLLKLWGEKDKWEKKSVNKVYILEQFQEGGKHPSKWEHHGVKGDLFLNILYGHNGPELYTVQVHYSYIWNMYLFIYLLTPFFVSPETSSA